MRENPLKHVAMWAVLWRDSGSLALMSSLVVWFHNSSKELCHHPDSLSFDLFVNCFGCQLANCLYLCTDRPTPYPVLPSFISQETVILPSLGSFAPCLLMGSANGWCWQHIWKVGGNEVGIYIPQVSPSGSLWLACFPSQKPLLLLGSPLLLPATELSVGSCNCFLTLFFQTQGHWECPALASTGVLSQTSFVSLHTTHLIVTVPGLSSP